MKKGSADDGNSYSLLVLAILLVLVTTITLSVIQSHNNQNIRSSAFFATATPTPPVQCSVTDAQIAIDTNEQRMFDLVNSYRINNKLPPFLWSPSLVKGAAWMSNDMLIHRSLTHIDSLGRSPLARLTSCGLQTSSSVAENIDSGSQDAAEIVGAWEHSPSQSANILNPALVFIGIGLSADANNNAFWAVDFASQQLPTATTAPTATGMPQLTQTQNLTPTAMTTKGQPTPTFRFPPTATPLPTKPFTPTHPPLPTATPLPTLPPGFVQNPFDTQLFVTVKIPGIGSEGNKRPVHLTRHVQVTIFDLTNQPVLSGYGFLIYDGALFRGIIHLGKLPDGTYYLKVVGDNTLEVLDVPQFQQLTSSKLNILPQVTLTQGDIDADNVLDLKDYNLALACFQDTKCQTANLLDFNDDGKSDVIDYNLLLQSFRKLPGD